MKRRSKPCPCAVAGCTYPAGRTVEIALPAAWEASDDWQAETIKVRLCPRCASEEARRHAAMQDARRELPSTLRLLRIIALSERITRNRLSAARDQLALVLMERELAAEAIVDLEARLMEAEGALALLRQAVAA